MQNGIEFFTATCLKWQPLLQPEEHKDIIINSLKFLVEDKRIWLYLPKVGVITDLSTLQLFLLSLLHAKRH